MCVLVVGVCVFILCVCVLVLCVCLRAPVCVSTLMLLSPGWALTDHFLLVALVALVALVVLKEECN